MESIIPMNTNIDFNTIIKKLLPFMVIILLAMSINAILYLFLPKFHFDSVHKVSKTIEYQKYKLRENFDEKKIVQETKVIETQKEYQLISNIELQMIYQDKNNGGWVVISEKSLKNSTILGVHETFKKYRLERIYSTYVIFSKYSKEYKLALTDEDTKVSYTKVQSRNKKEIGITKVDDQYQLTKKLITSYTKDSNKIWKEISIHEITKNGKIDGFKVTRIKKKSVFDQLGLKKNDVIKSVNNIQLKSYADAFTLYKKISTVKNMKFIVLRGDQEVELEYEIK